MANKNLIACLAVALLLRVGFVFIGFPALEQRWHLREDGDGYGTIAQTIRDGRYDDVTRGPVYPAFVAVAGSPLAVKVLQSLMDTLTCALIWWLTRSTLHAPRATLLAAWLWAVYPFAIWRVAFINKEVVLALLLVAYALVQIPAEKPWQWIGAGVLLGLVNLCKPMFLLWPVVLLVFAPRRAWLTVMAMLVVIAPWTYRNWRVTGGEFLPVATENGGMTAFVGNYQPALGLWEDPGKVRWQAAVEEIRIQNAGASVVTLDRAFYRAAWQQVVGSPVRALELTVRKCGRFWFLSAARREQAASVAIQAAYLALLVIGLGRTWPWSREVWVMLGLIGYVMLVHALSYADLRFSVIMVPYVCALACRTSATRSAATATS